MEPRVEFFFKQNEGVSVRLRNSRWLFAVGFKKESFPLSFFYSYYYYVLIYFGPSSPQDGAVHASLEPAQILYLTIAYDWFLFG